MALRRVLLSIMFISMYPAAEVTNTISDPRVNSSPHHRYDDFSSVRRRRTSTGPTVQGLKLAGIAINSVLKVAKQIYTDGYNKVYVKPGGRKKCYQDFYSVSPKKVTSINGHTLTGKVGNLVMTIEEKSDSTILTLRQVQGSLASNANPDLDYIVVYRH